MHATNPVVCFACGLTQPTAALASIPNGRPIAICIACAAVPDLRQAFVDAYKAARGTAPAADVAQPATTRQPDAATRA